ncbi:MAG: energy transducer TonB [Dechloromonas sp.]|nr:MAG: energy transducer TonB [Dechloromonas sp.]
MWYTAGSRESARSQAPAGDPPATSTSEGGTGVQAPVPILETTSSTVPADAAPVAVPAEGKPSTTSQASETLTHARFDADYLRNPAPPYPPLSRRVGEEGKVVLRVSVNPHGNADSVEIRTSSGSSRLDEAARKTVQAWKFIPAKRGETAVQSWVLIPIIFKLEQ